MRSHGNAHPHPVSAGLLLLAVLSGCGLPTPAADESLFASITLAPTVAPGTASFTGSLVDNARVRVLRPISTTEAQAVADTIVPFPATETSISLRLRIPLRARSERLLIVVELRMATTILFSGGEVVEVYAEGAGPTPLPRPVLIYVGPGEGARAIRIEPRDTVLSFATTATFRVKGFDQNDGPIEDLIVKWTTTSSIVSVSATGALTAPSVRGALFLRAETPTGISDSVRVRFAPPPALVAAIGGNNQVGLAGAILPQPLVVQVQAADGLGVPGVVVRFRPLLGGGLVGAQFVVTDDSGEARTSAQLGGTLGIYTFEAAVAGLTAVVFTATAL